MMAKRNIILLLSFLMFLGSNCYPLSWYDSVEIPDDASSLEKENLANLNKELKLAYGAFRNDDYYEMTDHIANALTFRPNHPDNIRLEYKMALAMSQYAKPDERRPMRRNEALKIYQKIAETYKHLDYYSSSPDDSRSIEDTQIMIPRTCIHIASLSMGLNGDYNNARKYISIGLDCLYETYKKRKADWLSEPKPKKIPDFYDTMGTAEGKWKMRVEEWEERQRRAAQDDVFGDNEMMYAKVSVRNYGMSFGDNQGIGDVIVAMNQIIEKYPSSPMARVAESYIENAKNTVINNMDKVFLDKPDTSLKTVETQTNLIENFDKKELAGTEVNEHKNMPEQQPLNPDENQNEEKSPPPYLIVGVSVLIAFIIFAYSKNKRAS